jgi:hypothetical protein
MKTEDIDCPRCAIAVPADLAADPNRCIDPQCPLVGIQPTEADVGRKVVRRYKNSNAKPKEGVIAWFDAKSVYVGYGDDPVVYPALRRDLLWVNP